MPNGIFTIASDRMLAHCDPGRVSRASRTIRWDLLGRSHRDEETSGQTQSQKVGLLARLTIWLLAWTRNSWLPTSRPCENSSLRDRDTVIGLTSTGAVRDEEVTGTDDGCGTRIRGSSPPLRPCVLLLSCPSNPSPTRI